MAPKPPHYTTQNSEHEKDTSARVPMRALQRAAAVASMRISERSYELAVRECLVSQSMVMSMLTEFLAEIE